MAKNLKAKERPISDPYEVYRNDSGWEWRVLRHYQSEEGEARNPYARVFCQVSSPYCPEGELGDVYLSDITVEGKARLIKATIDRDNGVVVSIEAREAARAVGRRFGYGSEHDAPSH